MDGHAYFPGWLESLLRLVHDNFGKELSVFCITCCEGFYEGAELEHMHHQHSCLQMHQFQQAVTVKLDDLVRVGVNPSSIQTFHSPNDHSLFILLLNTFRNIALSDSLPKCARCCCQLYQTTCLFCCLDCKFRIMKNVPPAAAQLQARLNSLGDVTINAKSLNQIENSVQNLPSQKVSCPPVDASISHDTMMSSERGNPMSDRPVSGDITTGSSKVCTCKPFGAFEVYVPKIAFASWPWGRGKEWIGSLMQIKSLRFPLLPQYEPIGKKETCGLSNCAICFPSEEFLNDRAFDFEDDIICLLEEGKFGSFQNPAVSIQSRFNPFTSLQQLTLNSQQWWSR